jgi:class 3 adenylate cyclase
VDQGLGLTPGSVYGPVSIPARSKTPGEKLSGMAVVIGVRLRAQAAPSDVMVWSTVGDLVAVSRLDFEDGGEHELTGVHRRWGLVSRRPTTSRDAQEQVFNRGDEPWCRRRPLDGG